MKAGQCCVNLCQDCTRYFLSCYHEINTTKDMHVYNILCGDEPMIGVHKLKPCLTFRSGDYFHWSVGIYIQFSKVS